MSSIGTRKTPSPAATCRALPGSGTSRSIAPVVELDEHEPRRLVHRDASDPVHDRDALGRRADLDDPAWRVSVRLRSAGRLGGLRRVELRLRFGRSLVAPAPGDERQERDGNEPSHSSARRSVRNTRSTLWCASSSARM